MSKKTIITPEDILNYIESHEYGITRRDLARAFALKGSERIVMKDILRDLLATSRIKKLDGKYIAQEQGELVIVEVVEISKSGTVIGIPTTELFKDTHSRIKVYSSKSLKVKIGDRALVRLSTDKLSSKFIQFVKNIESKRIVGELHRGKRGAWIIPSDKKNRDVYSITDEFTRDAQNGDIVIANVTKNPKSRSKIVEISEIIGNRSDPRCMSLIAIFDNQIPFEFSKEALKLADAAKLPTPKDREDLRHIPFVTIDGEDARDFDDAVWAEPDLTPGNPGGWHAIVAIADVAYYVRPGDALDLAAQERGNSVYFPDRVVPMLPESLSNGMCSLRPNEDRAALAVHLMINKNGKTIGSKFSRCLIRSSARLTYEQVQAMRDKDQLSEPLKSLYGAFESLLQFRNQRGTLELNIPEKYIVLNEQGKIESISLRKQLPSHQLIEELMIAANVAAAKLLTQKSMPCMYRVHDKPDIAKIANLKTFLQGTAIKLPAGLEPNHKDLNKIIAEAKETKYADVISELVLRSQAQAEYSPHNIGHFGLNLKHYAHFTSPIRRYADLLVHRALIAALGFGNDGLESDNNFKQIGQHLGFTERRAAIAERDTKDRLIAAFMETKIGQTFVARITTVTSFGLFAIIDEFAATGLVHIKNLKGDFFVFDESGHRLLGRRRKQSFQMGDMINVVVEEANPLTGGIEFRVKDF